MAIFNTYASVPEGMRMFSDTGLILRLILRFVWIHTLIRIAAYVALVPLEQTEMHDTQDKMGGFECQAWWKKTDGDINKKPDRVSNVWSATWLGHTRIPGWEATDGKSSNGHVQLLQGNLPVSAMSWQMYPTSWDVHDALKNAQTPS